MKETTWLCIVPSAGIGFNLAAMAVNIHVGGWLLALVPLNMVFAGVCACAWWHMRKHQKN